LRHAVCAAFLLALALLPGCSNLALEKEDAPAAGADAAYTKLVADYIKGTFKNHASYEAFEISGARWMHTLHGWNSLTCVRFQDHGQQRTYAVFIKNGAVVDARYAVQTDACGAETYTPFETMTSGMRSPNPGAQGPIY
jgi:hypothetical protein